MARNLKGKKTPSVTEPWVKNKKSTEKQQAEKALKKCKDHEATKKVKYVKVEGQPRCWKRVEVKK